MPGFLALAQGRLKLFAMWVIAAAVTFRKDVAGRRLFRPPGERLTPPRQLWDLAVH